MIKVGDSVSAMLMLTLQFFEHRDLQLQHLLLGIYLFEFDGHHLVCNYVLSGVDLPWFNDIRKFDV